MARTDGTPAVLPRCLSVNAFDATITAAAPSEVAQMSSSRSGSETTGLASTSSTEVSLAVPGIRLPRPCWEFFTFTAAKSSTVAP